MPMFSRRFHRRLITMAAWTAVSTLAQPAVGLAQGTPAKVNSSEPSQAEMLDAFTQRKAAGRLLAEMGSNTTIDTKVSRLIDRLVLRDHAQVQATVTALTMLGQPAVPAIIQHIDDRRNMLVQHIAFENRFVGAFEAVRQYGVIKIVDCLAHVLDDITGESFGHVDISPAAKTRRETQEARR